MCCTICFAVAREEVIERAANEPIQHDEEGARVVFRPADAEHLQDVFFQR